MEKMIKEITAEDFNGNSMTIESGKSYKIKGYGRGRTCTAHVTAILPSDNEGENIVVFKYWRRFAWKYIAIEDYDFADRCRWANK